MWTDVLRARLEALNRQTLPPAPNPNDIRANHNSHVGQQAELFPSAGVSASNSRRPCWSWQLGEERQSEAGPYWHLERPLAQLWPGAVRAWDDPAEPPRRLAIRPTMEATRHETDGAFLTGPAEASRPSAARSASDPLVSARQALRASWPGRVLLLDLETCGWAGSIAFLIGLIRLSNGQAVIEQLLARDYREERAILAALWQRLDDDRLLITFNGKSFDWPAVHDRSNVHRLGRDDRGRQSSTGAPSPANEPGVDPAERRLLGPRDRRPAPLHFDALHHARRQWRGQLPDYRLQTLEQTICRRHRRHDLGGREIPAAYHAFVRTGDDGDLNRILEHNAWDLVTLAQLSWVLAFEPDPRERAA